MSNPNELAATCKALATTFHLGKNDVSLVEEFIEKYINLNPDDYSLLYKLEKIYRNALDEKIASFLHSGTVIRAERETTLDDSGCYYQYFSGYEIEYEDFNYWFSPSLTERDELEDELENDDYIKVLCTVHEIEPAVEPLLELFNLIEKRFELSDGDLTFQV